MRKPLLPLLALTVLVLGGATLFFYSQYRRSESTNASLQSASRDTQDQYARTIGAIAEIQDSLNAIALGDQGLPPDNASLRDERRMGPPSGQEAIERVALLRSSIERNKLRIDRLEAELKHSRMRAVGLQKLIAGLRRTTAEKEQQIAELSLQVGSLQTQVTGLATQVAEVQDTVRTRDAALSDRQRELATVYWVADNRRALTRSGVIEARGGVLGIGRTMRPSARGSDNAFQPLNTDEQTVLPLPTARARVISSQPLSSYELRRVNGKLELHILSPRDFRKVRQLVIVTA